MFETSFQVIQTDRLISGETNKNSSSAVNELCPENKLIKNSSM